MCKENIGHELKLLVFRKPAVDEVCSVMAGELIRRPLNQLHASPPFGMVIGLGVYKSCPVHAMVEAPISSFESTALWGVTDVSWFTREQQVTELYRTSAAR